MNSNPETPRWTCTITPSDKGARMNIATDADDVVAAEVVHHLLNAAATLNRNPLGRLLTRAEVDAQEEHARVLRERPAASCWFREALTFWFSAESLTTGIGEHNEPPTLEAALLANGWTRVPGDPGAASHPCDFVLKAEAVRAALA